ncbi:Mitogen-activated protein kinase kinase kinase 1 [Rhynchospora pubera]|uniref:mitogen-activated protein kinase kinase kinase n=1 Tax=Rhynchospora pubera TaxID=906938 RepID=A0AAV8HH57_9POAL|nr:Mitogen-activated protein kinase kinase kinase 1 [Rhynchospora pubera]
MDSSKKKAFQGKKLQLGGAPRLDRRNASKNIDYDVVPTDSPASWCSPSSPSSDLSNNLRTSKSLDIMPSTYSNQTSFRIGGSIEGEVDLLYSRLGLSGPEDFSIPVAAWEARKARSISDLLPRSRIIDQVQLDASPLEELDQGVNETREDRTQLLDLPKDEEKIKDENTTTEHDVPEEVTKVTPLSPRKGGNSIRGIRPPVLSPPLPILTPQVPGILAPPPVMRTLAEEVTIGSVWDLISSFAPKEGEVEVKKFGDSDEETEINLISEIELRLGETSEGFTGTSSVSTVNDDDASSSTTETWVSPNGRIKRRIKSWVKGQQLGSGSFGTVHEAISDEGFFFAVKEVLLDQGTNAQQSVTQLEQEVALLSQFEHENIVQYYGTERDERKLYILLELVTQGSLASLHQKYQLQDTHVSAYTRQILYGLVYLHERNILHRDIKCANILVHANGSVKLADFGLAKEMTKINILKSTKGSVYWMAPEVVNPKKAYGLAADIWSLGCTVLEMLTHQIPYPNVEWMQAFFKIGRGEAPPIPDNLSKEAQDFIMQCVRVNPDDRPSAVQLLEHPFVKRPLPLRASPPASRSSPSRTDPNYFC